jgi:hypothetical protein
VDWPAKWGFEGLGIEATRASRRLFLNRFIAEVKRALLLLLLWAGKKAASEKQSLARSAFAFVIGLRVRSSSGSTLKKSARGPF